MDNNGADIRDPWRRKKGTFEAPSQLAIEIWKQWKSSAMLGVHHTGTDVK